MAKETNEQLIARKEIKAALEGLLQACKNNNMAFVGFAWGIEPPIIMRFGNIKETGVALTNLLLELDDTANEKKDSGLIVSDPLTGMN